MNLKYLGFYACFLAIYGFINYYIGLRGWQALSKDSLRWGWYWAIIVLIGAASFPLGRWLAAYLPRETAQIIIYIGSYWLGIMYYLLLIIIFIDLIRLIDRFTGLVPTVLKCSPSYLALLTAVILVLLFSYGTWNARHPVVRNYEVNIARQSGQLDKMRVVVVSDIHLGWIVGHDRLEEMIAAVNALNPDLVLLPGDIIDEGVDLASEQEIPQIFSRLNPRLGTYAVPGNHEYISGQAEGVIGFLGRGGVKVLRDQWIEVAGSFYLVGRDSVARRSFAAGNVRDLKSIMEDIDLQKLPVFLMDHEPSRLEEAEQAGVALQFSGHTHRGQLAPNQYITRSIFEIDWGYLKKGNLQIFVSSGYGTWGPPLRIGNRPEIVNITVNFVRGKG